MCEAHICYETHPNDVSDAFAYDFTPRAIILSGSHASIYENHRLRVPQAVWGLDVPVLGIYYGMQTMAVQLGDKMEWSDHREFDYAEMRAHGHTHLLEDIQDFATPEGYGILKTWMSHGDKVAELPPSLKLLASTPSYPVAGMTDETRGYYAIQFHSEVMRTTQGRAMLERFMLEIAGAKPDQVMRDHIGEAVKAIRKQMDNEEVILRLSGGVGSSVAIALIRRTIGDQLACMFIDHGLLRLNEDGMVMNMFAGRLYAKIVHVDASEQLLGHLAGVTDPETRRKTIGHEFVEIFQAEAKKLGNAKWLAQGMIYPDAVESGGTKTEKATTIKSHHNMGDLSETLGLKLPKPLRDPFKDKVCELDMALGLPHEVMYRHPSPGLDLDMRVLSEVKCEYIDLLRRIDVIFIEELRSTRTTAQDASTSLYGEDGVGKGWYDLTGQALTVFLPIKPVSVIGGGRTYDCVTVLHTVWAADFMIVHRAHLPYMLLGRVSNRIISEARGLSRVIYDASGKPPVTIEWERSSLPKSEGTRVMRVFFRLYGRLPSACQKTTPNGVYASNDQPQLSAFFSSRQTHRTLYMGHENILTMITRAEGNLVCYASVVLSKTWSGASRLWSSIAAQAEQGIILTVLSRVYAHCGTLIRRWDAGQVSGGRLSNYLLTQI